jgi:predicted flap endonuclease-1-like 5' DNA nuclease
MSCCFWWFLLGALLGWLLNWLLCRLTGCCNKKTNNIQQTVAPVVSAPVAKTAPVAAAAPVAAEPVKATAKPAATKSFVLDTTAAKAAGYKLRGPNDLTVIEGIGPKINQLFNTAGFNTFVEVSKMTEGQMQKILDDAGPRYRLAKPGTWAKQAELAAQNKWSELKTWQDSLKHGV